MPITPYYDREMISALITYVRALKLTGRLCSMTTTVDAAVRFRLKGTYDEVLAQLMAKINTMVEKGTTEKDIEEFANTSWKERAELHYPQAPIATAMMEALTSTGNVDDDVMMTLAADTFMEGIESAPARHAAGRCLCYHNH